MDKIETLQKMIDDSENIVFFGGAGVSTESGIPDFRSVDGLYNQTYAYPPETILSHTFYMRKKEEFYKFYRDKMLITDKEPNAAHKKLAELEAAGKLSAVVTQNIDGLHQKAGSKNVFELHGSIHRNYCENCHAFYDANYLLDHKGVPKCRFCGNDIKPDVVLYEEPLNQEVMMGATSTIKKADMLIIGGTSLAVYPAAGMVDYFYGKYLVLINKGALSRDRDADLIIRDKIGKVLGAIKVNS